MDFFATWALIFFIYSFVGWLVEVIRGLVLRHKFVNRGFLIGPICPIYGFGALLLTLTLSNIENPVAIFCVSFIGGSALEYFTSFFMEKLFHVRWWDYSDRKIHLNGRICLTSSIYFGLAGILMVKFLNPLLLGLLSSLPSPLIITLAVIFILLYLADTILSIVLICGFRVTVGTVAKDATDEISERVREIIMTKGKLSRRLLTAFPNQKPAHKLRKRS